MADPNPNQMMTCPYNLSHQVENFKMHIHLQKCRKQHRGCKKQCCPFDATHIINDVEMEYHVNVCPKRILLDQQMYVTNADHREVVEVVKVVPVINSEEDWDDESTSYKPDLSKKGPHIIRKIRGATRSERRMARMEGVKNYRPQ